MSLGGERRASTRIPVQLQVRFRDLGRPSENFEDLTTNISAGGIFVETSVAFAVGTPVELEIAPSNGAPAIRLRAEVVRTEEEPGVLGSRATTEMRTKGIALRLVGADSETLIRLLSVAKQGERNTIDIPISVVGV